MRQGDQPRRRHPMALFVLAVLLFTLPGLVPPGGAADPPSETPHERGPDVAAAYAAAEEARLFGKFQSDDGRHEGLFTSLTTDADTGALWGIWHDGRPLVEMIDVGLTNGTVENRGVAVVLQNTTSAFTVHDNRYGWITFRGSAPEVRLRFPTGSDVESGREGLSAQVENRTVNLFYTGPQPNVTMDGTSVRLRPRDGEISFTIALRSGVFGRDPLPGGWALVARAGESVVIDHLGDPRYKPLIDPVTQDQIHLGLPRLDSLLDRDVIHRIESTGVFPVAPAVGVAVHDGDDLSFRPTNLTRIYSGERAVAWSNVTRTEGDVIQAVLRQPLGFAGEVRLEADATPPQIIEVKTENATEHWLPGEHPPRLVVRTDERVTAALTIDGPEGNRQVRNETPTTNPWLPLDILRPDTRYDWNLTVTDLAMNQNRITGSLHTAKDPLELIPQVEIHEPRDGEAFRPGERIQVVASVDDGAGRPLPHDQVTVRLNGRLIKDVTWDGTQLVARLGLVEDGRHTVEVSAAGHAEAHVVSSEVSFRVAVGAPTPPASLFVTLIVLIGAVIAARRR